MAVTQLQLYNDALLLLGQRSLSSLSEAREPRYRLDEVYAIEAINYCLEIAEPLFAHKTAKLTSSSTSSQHDLDNVFTLPADYVSLIGVFSDANLDQPVQRYMMDGLTVACNHSTIYLRYISNGYALSVWSPTFAKVVSAYLAREISERISPDKYSEIDAKFTERVKTVRDLTAAKVPARKPTKATTTLSATWLAIYNDALYVLGLPEITGTDDDSFRRVRLDRALAAALVESLLEDTGWSFARTSTRLQYDPGLEPAFGYRRVHAKPADMQIIFGVYQDEYMTTPLRLYRDEGAYFFSDLDTIYLEYISSTFLTTPDNWPAFFKRLVAARMAKDAAPGIPDIDVNGLARIDNEYTARRINAMSIDAMNSPPKIFAAGNWVSSRFRNSGRGRPGDR